MSQEGYRTRYENTYAMTINPNGRVVTPPIALGEHVRFNRRDKLLVLGNKVLIPSANEKEGKLELVVIDVK